MVVDVIKSSMLVAVSRSVGEIYAFAKLSFIFYVR